MEDLIEKLKVQIIEQLNLEDMEPEDIDPEDPLFGNGLGLDSIDALELGVALQKKYGVKLETKKEEMQDHFANVKSLAAFIENLRVMEKSA